MGSTITTYNCFKEDYKMTSKLPTIFSNQSLNSFFDHSVGFDRLFDSLFDDFMPSVASTTFPPYNIRKEGEKDRVIELAVAGYNQNDIDISLNNDVLTISAQKMDEDEKQSDGYLYKGLASRSFKRQFKLSDHADVAKATMKDGMLYIHIRIDEPENEVLKIPIQNE